MNAWKRRQRQSECDVCAWVWVGGTILHDVLTNGEHQEDKWPAPAHIYWLSCVCVCVCALVYSIWFILLCSKNFHQYFIVESSSDKRMRRMHDSLLLRLHFTFCFHVYNWSHLHPYMSFRCYFQLGALKRVQWNFSCFACSMRYVIRVAHGGPGPFVIYIYLFFISSTTWSTPPLHGHILHCQFFACALRRSAVFCESVSLVHHE